MLKQEEETDVPEDLFDTTSTRQKLENGSDKTKVLRNNPNSFQLDTKIKGERLEAVNNYTEPNLQRNTQMARFLSEYVMQDNLSNICCSTTDKESLVHSE